MSFTLDQALAQLGTSEYSGIDGLRRLVAETSAVATNAADGAVSILYSGSIASDVPGSEAIPSFQIANSISDADDLYN